MPRNSILAFFIVVSLFGLAVVMASAFFQPQLFENLPLRKPLVGSIFGLFCVAGMVAVFFPEPCSRAISFRGEKRMPRILKTGDSVEKKLSFRGHHPNCKNFSAHVFQMGSKTLCAGCTGLFVGGLAAFIGALLYFFGGSHIGQAGLLLFLIGAAGVILGLLQPPLLSVPWSSIRLFINAFFSFGAFLVLAAVDDVTQSIFIDLFLIVLIGFWIFTKISLSRWGHDQICRQCKVNANCADFRWLAPAA